MCKKNNVYKNHLSLSTIIIFLFEILIWILAYCICCHANKGQYTERQTHTPNERLWSSHVSHSAGILFVLAWSKAHMSAEVVVPVLFKGQVSLFGSRHLLFILEQLNGDFWWVEAAHMTDERVGFPELSRYTAVHLNLWWSYIETETSLTRAKKIWWNHSKTQKTNFRFKKYLSITALLKVTNDSGH